MRKKHLGANIRGHIVLLLIQGRLEEVYEEWILCRERGQTPLELAGYGVDSRTRGEIRHPLQVIFEFVHLFERRRGSTRLDG